MAGPSSEALIEPPPPLARAAQGLHSSLLCPGCAEGHVGVAQADRAGKPGHTCDQPLPCRSASLVEILLEWVHFLPVRENEMVMVPLHQGPESVHRRWQRTQTGPGRGCRELDIEHRGSPAAAFTGA